MKNSLSIITTCRGRLHHLKQTLPAMLAQGADEVIVVDYDCPDGTGDWVQAHHPDVVVVRAEDPLGFCAARARNIGARQASSPWLAFIDADNILQTGWLSYVSSLCADRTYSVPEWDETRKDSFGALVCRKADFLRAGLYDEALRGWSPEDTDMRLRFSALGLSCLEFPTELIEPISHEDNSRNKIADLDMTQMKVRSLLYLFLKPAINATYGGFPICCRAALLDTIATTVRERNATKPRDCFPFRFHRYCPACAAHHSANVEIVLEKRRGGLFRRSGLRLVERGIASQRSHA